jgi:hypothetical protein
VSRRLTAPPLYCTEEQVAELVLGPGHLRDWRDRVVVLERQGLPRIDPLMGGRYWPAVLAFFDRFNGISDKPPVPTMADGPEDFSSTPKRKNVA